MTLFVKVAERSRDPNHLFDLLLKRMNLESDAALSRVLDVAPSVISKVRNGRVAVNALLMLRIHEATNLSIREIRNLMGDTSTKYFQNEVQEAMDDMSMSLRPNSRRNSRGHSSPA